MADYNSRKAEFLKLFASLARYKHRYDVFRDFVTMSACTLHNAILMDEEREAEYLTIIASYKKENQSKFPELFALLVMMLDEVPKDVLGTLYMELGIANKDQGQFYTPSHISDLMAEITYGEELGNIEKPFITLSEPCCGAGGMVLSFVKTMIAQGHNPAEKLWVQCIDIDRLSALMCYVQLSLWNVPAQVLVGNTLSWEMRECWYTQAHHLGMWDCKLAQREKSQDHEAMRPEETKRAQELPLDTPNERIQFDFGF